MASSPSSHSLPSPAAVSVEWRTALWSAPPSGKIRGHPYPSRRKSVHCWNVSDPKRIEKRYPDCLGWRRERVAAVGSDLNPGRRSEQGYCQRQHNDPDEFRRGRVQRLSRTLLVGHQFRRRAADAAATKSADLKQAQVLAEAFSAKVASPHTSSSLCA